MKIIMLIFKKSNDWLSVVIPDEVQKLSLVEDVTNQLISIINNDPIAAEDTPYGFGMNIRG